MQPHRTLPNGRHRPLRLNHTKIMCSLSLASTFLYFTLYYILIFLTWYQSYFCVAFNCLVVSFLSSAHVFFFVQVSQSTIKTYNTQRVYSFLFVLCQQNEVIPTCHAPSCALIHLRLPRASHSTPTSNALSRALISLVSV